MSLIFILAIIRIESKIFFTTNWHLFALSVSTFA